MSEAMIPVLVLVWVQLLVNIMVVVVCEGACTDVVWCSVPMPKESHYRFLSPPTDAKRWEEAKQIAASGRQVFAERALQAFPYPDDFLGDCLIINL